MPEFRGCSVAELVLIFALTGFAIFILLQGRCLDAKFGFNRFTYNDRSQLNCCKCEGDPDKDNFTSASGVSHGTKLDQYTCDLDFKARNSIIKANNLTCPVTSFLNGTGCGDIRNKEDISGLSSSTFPPRAVLLLSPKGKWVKCCCSPHFCKNTDIPKASRCKKSSSESTIVNRHQDQCQCPQKRPPHLRPRPKLITALEFMQTVTTYLLQCTISMISCILVFEILMALLMDPTNLWNDLREPEHVQEAIFEIVWGIVNGVKILGASP